MSHTVVLVHGAFAESSSWDGVIDAIQADGHHVVAVANPLRGLASDASAVADVVRSIEGPIVLAAHSYGGAVMTNVPADAGDIVGLVYISAFAPDAGENCFGLAARFPGSMVGPETVRPVPRADGTTDLSIAVDAYPEIFCPDLPAEQARRLAVTQRPATQEALTEASGDRPLWKDVPSWFLIGEADRIIPAELQRFEAERAGSRRTVACAGASHAVAVSQPRAVADFILEAAREPAGV